MVDADSIVSRQKNAKKIYWQLFCEVRKVKTPFSFLVWKIRLEGIFGFVASLTMSAMLNAALLR